jgi:hypothetical protein
MRQPLVVSFAVAALIVAAVIGGVLYMKRGAHLELQGKVLKVRTAPLDDNNSLAVVDFRITDVSDIEFDVRQVTVILEDKSGQNIEGMTISAVDSDRLFQNIPILGEKYNPALIVRNRIAAHATEDRMIAASFAVPQSVLESRKGLTVRIEEVDGAVSEIR